MYDQGLTKQDIEKKVGLHTVVMCFWIFAIVIVLVYPERFNWVFVAAALAYLALDELANILFWRKYGADREGGAGL